MQYNICISYIYMYIQSSTWDLEGSELLFYPPDSSEGVCKLSPDVSRILSLEMTHNKIPTDTHVMERRNKSKTWNLLLSSNWTVPQ